MASAALDGEEVQDLVLSILEAVEATEEGVELRRSWPGEMRDWCELLLSRLDRNRA